ncbi:MAG: hypothetical protein QN203_10820 [Armatimonadota bacterium]|nr:hypothetical protein [Armatimonadota bacterium]
MAPLGAVDGLGAAGRACQPEVREALRTVVRTSGGEEVGGWLEVRLPALAGARSQLRWTLRDVGRPA